MINLQTLFDISDVVGGIDMARRYLTSCFIRILVVSDHYDAPPNPQLLAAHEERINCISFERCNFIVRKDNEREKKWGDTRPRWRSVALTGARGQGTALVVARDDSGQLFVKNSNIPGACQLLMTF